MWKQEQRENTTGRTHERQARSSGRGVRILQIAITIDIIRVIRVLIRVRPVPRLCIVRTPISLLYSAFAEH
jgi:hypothetical protein